MLAYPDGIKLVHDLFNQFGVVGEDARLEVARTIAFHADACTGEVGTTDIGHLAIEDQNLEMYSRTKRPLQAIKQGWVFVEVLTERGTWLFGMNEPHLNAFFDELCQDRKEGLRLRPYLDIKVFDIGSANLTGAGIGMKGDDTRNFEAGILTDNPELVEQAMNQFDEVWIGKHCKACKRKDFCGDPIGL